MIKVAIIGARNRNSGLGGYVARWFSQAGARICAVIGTTPETAEEACRNLQRRYNIETSAYTSMEAVAKQEGPDIFAICSPTRFHYEHLQAVQQAGTHCLCEKPMWWGESRDRKAETARIVDGFIQQRRYLDVLTQWPCTLPFYFDLYHHLHHQPVETFEMRMGSSGQAGDMILDALPHPLSLLLRLVGPGEVQSSVRKFFDADQRELDLRFGYRHRKGTTSVTVKISTKATPPRPAWYGINGYLVERTIDPVDYSMALVGNGRTIKIDDPLQLKVEEFLHKVKTNAPVEREALIGGMGALEILVREP